MELPAVRSHRSTYQLTAEMSVLLGLVVGYSCLEWAMVGRRRVEVVLRKEEELGGL